MPTTTPADGAVMTRRQLNRSLLARQLLLERSTMTTPAALEHLVGMQSQVPAHPFIALWSRLAGFETDDLSRMMLDRTAVRTLLMRGTIHLVTADDCLRLRPIMQELYERLFPAIAAFGPNVAGMDLDALLAAGRAHLEAQPRTGKALAALLAGQWPERDPASMSQAVRHYLPLVQVTPRGVWGKSQQATWTTVEAWLGRGVDEGTAPDATILRYLAAFGPATVADVQTWSRLQGLREPIERLRPRLRVYRNERGQELFDVPGAPFPDPETPAPPRFLPVYDNALLSHADRTRIIADEHRQAIATPNGLFDATFLIDGVVAGVWKVEQARKPSRAILRLQPFAPLTGADREALEAEGERLLFFLAPGAETREVAWREDR
ncbi:MAG TPA: winged helix DNA-binding domain-containing protein [Thermomicrobiales bacterium]|nr:winged helix DNA-binding domain-containing protein [Thermomicrobiales bacterium]